MSIPIGIDLGTTYSCVACWDENTESIQVIPNDIGEKITPSVIAWVDNQTIVGQEAKTWLEEAPNSVLWEVKRFIGRDIQEQSVQDDIKQVTYLIQENQESKSIEIKINKFNSDNSAYTNDNVIITPIEASAIILNHLKKCAENYLGNPVKEAVITVPAYFGEPQREATKLAGELAGMKVLRVIPEPTAAALSYYQTSMKDTSNLKNILVYDWGGGTLDVSILSMEGGIVEVLSIAGDHHLGGEDIDHILIERVWIEWIRRLNITPTNENDEMPKLSETEKCKLRIILERIKRNLSSTSKVKIPWDPYPAILDYYSEKQMTPTHEQRQEMKKPFWITRLMFEEWCEGIFHRALKPVDDAIYGLHGKLSENNIHEIILVGGSTRIPAIQDALQRRFPNAIVHQKINPDECVAIGAGVQSALLAGITNKKLEDVLLLDVLPFSLGIETIGGVMTKLLERNTTLPAFSNQTFTTNEDDQESVEVFIYQGERAFAKDNMLLGRFELHDIPPASRGTPRIEVSFSVDANGILEVHAEEKVTGKKCGIRVQASAGGLSQKEKERMIQDAENNKDNDQKRKEQIEMKHELEHWLYRIEKAIESSQWSKNNEILNIIYEWKCWIQDNSSLDKKYLEEELSKWKTTAQRWIDFLKKNEKNF